ncbi:ABC transporter [Streptomyces sp. NBC_01236]|uniref:ABC transporter n=1 Tax=Streptomyces sp. NBC_01236 TaxID=2903789 RepID=UPI002E1404C4
MRRAVTGDTSGPGTPARERTPATRRPYALIRALARPVWRTLPRRALATGAVLGLLLAGIPRMFSAPDDGWLCLSVLRAAALAFGLGLAFLLDDPARHTTAAVPARRPVRTGLRMALVAPFTALWWTAALLLVPEQGRPPVGAVTLEAAATAVLALAAATLAVRYTETAEPGIAVSSGLVGTALGAALLLPDRWELFVAVTDPRWDAAHQRWAGILAVAALVVVCRMAEPTQRWRVTSFAHR